MKLAGQFKQEFCPVRHTALKTAEIRQVHRKTGAHRTAALVLRIMNSKALSHLELAGKVALVTGASAGIGRSTAEVLAAAGASVLVADVQDEMGQAVVDRISSAGGVAAYLHVDVSSADDVRLMVQTAVDRWGRLDCAINNAGVAGVLSAELVDCPDDVFDRVVNVNLRGVFLCMKHEIKQMLSQEEGGVIVNVASAAGLVGLSNAAYTASKHGVVGITKSAAIAYSKKGIRVNAVCPGYVDTQIVSRVRKAGDDAVDSLVAMHPVGRLGEPAEIAQAIAWLCSDGASFVAGHAMAVDGGLVAW